MKAPQQRRRSFLSIVDDVDAAFHRVAKSNEDNPKKHLGLWRPLKQELTGLLAGYQENAAREDRIKRKQQMIIDGRPHYSQVKWLDMYWVSSNIDMRPEITSFRKLRERYFFHDVESYQIPLTHVNASTTTALKRFFKGGNQNTLFVVYYSGHGNAGERGLELSG
jgi:hypothetical protein